MRHLPLRPARYSALAILACAPVTPLPAQAAPDCTADSTYTTLDFWIGSWDVYVGDTLVGTNRISAVLRGCAVVEEWEDARGGQGRSLFYVEPGTDRWKQVWVTHSPRRPGGVKEKRQVPPAADGGVRFLGEVSANGGARLDRTTLLPLPSGEVRQLIEVSDDGGTTWRAVFDARYRRRRARRRVPAAPRRRPAGRAAGPRAPPAIGAAPGHRPAAARAELPPPPARRAGRPPGYAPARDARRR